MDIHIRAKALEKIAGSVKSAYPLESVLPSRYNLLPYRLFTNTYKPPFVTTRRIDETTGAESVGMNAYWCRLLHNPKFQQRLATPKVYSAGPVTEDQREDGAREASYLAQMLSNTPVYEDNGTPEERKTGRTDSYGGGVYNPITNNVTVYPWVLDKKTGKFKWNADHVPGTIQHELGHALYYNSPNYRARIKEIMTKHNIPWDALYDLSGSQSAERTGYYNQPTEQAAELQRFRFSTGLMPGSGSGPNGEFTNEDIIKAKNSGKYNAKERKVFDGLSDDYLRDLLNYAKVKKQPTNAPNISAVA